MVYNVRDKVVDDQILTLEVDHLGVPISKRIEVHVSQPRRRETKGERAKRLAGSEDFVSPAISPQYMSVWKQSRVAGALRVSGGVPTPIRCRAITPIIPLPLKPTATLPAWAERSLHDFKQELNLCFTADEL